MLRFRKSSGADHRQPVRPKQPAMRQAAVGRRVPWYAWAAGGCLAVLAVTALSTVYLLRHENDSAVPPADAGLLHVVTDPPGAEVSVDGERRGSTPIELMLRPGRHSLRVDRDGYQPAVADVNLPARGDFEVSRRLWRDQPLVTPLHPPLPGLRIELAQPLSDGRVAMVLSEPSGLREAWVTSPGGRPSKLEGMHSRSAVLSVSHDGRSVAYLGPERQEETDALDAGRDYTELWVAHAGGEARRLGRLKQGEGEFADISWSPDGRHLLAIIRIGGGLDTPYIRVLSLPVEGDPGRELAVLPVDVVPDSYLWSPDGTGVAFLVSGGQGASLCVVRVDGSLFKYLGDAGGDIWTTAELSSPPLSWTPDNRGVYYALPSIVAADGEPTHTVLYNDLDGGDSRVIARVDADQPVLSDDGRLLGVSVTDDGRAMLRGLDGPGAAEFASRLPLLPSEGLGFRWDAAGARAIVSTAGDPFAPASSATYWILRWTEAVRQDPTPTHEGE